MIRHDFYCKECNDEYEVTVEKMADKIPNRCIYCGSKEVEKIYNSTVGFMLKPGGVGWADKSYSG